MAKKKSSIRIRGFRDNCKQKDADDTPVKKWCNMVKDEIFCTRPKNHKGMHHAHGINSGMCYLRW